jgi:Mrp family chromosome partitioning ATPase
VTRLVLAVRSHESELASAATRHGHEVTIAAAGTVLAELETTAPDLVVIASDPATLSSAVLAACDARGIRVIALVADEAGRQHAAALGLHDLVEASAEWTDIEQVITGQRRPAPPRGTTGGVVIAVWGPAGSPGRSTLAIGIAAELAAAGHSVALGDVDTHAASIAPSLGLLDEAPGFAAACRLAGSDSLSIAELERIAQRYSSGHGSFWVLTGLGRPTRWPELSHDKVVGTIRQCRSWVDYTVLDTGFSLENDEEISSDLFAPKRNAATIAALREADVVVAVGAADPVGLSRFLRSHLTLLETLDSARVIVVANKVRASAIGLNPSSQVQQTLSRFGSIDDAELVAHDQAGLDAALLSGRTLLDVAPKSPARLAIQALVRSRILPQVAATKRRLRVS